MIMKWSLNYEMPFVAERAQTRQHFFCFFTVFFFVGRSKARNINSSVTSKRVVLNALVPRLPDGFAA